MHDRNSTRRMRRLGAPRLSDQVPKDGARDKVTCGPGKDRVRADRRDRVKKSCERAKR